MSGRILVTGSAGFLGRHLCALLKARGDEPIGLDLQSTENGPWEEVQGSVTDLSTFEAAGQVDGVLHGAALTDLWQKDPGAFERVNVGGTKNAACFARSQNAPLVIISSYTTLMNRGIASETVINGQEENAPRELFGPYPASKRQAVIEAKAMVPDLTVVYPTAPLGPGDYRLTPPMKLVRDLAAGSLPGVMRGRINVVDIRDAAMAILEALEHPGGRYLVGAQDLTLMEFAEAVATTAGVKPPGMNVPPFVARAAAHAEALICQVTKKPPNAPIDGVNLAALPVTFDASAAKADLGFRPRPLEETLRDGIDFLVQEELLSA